MLNGKDTAENEVTVQKKVVSLDLDKPNAPVINSNVGYATLTSYGVKFDDKATIIYDSRTDIDNYYSTDNGVTWKKYTGEFNLISGTILAKSVKKDTGLEVVVSKTLTMPADAMKKEAYDGNINTSTNEYNGKGVMNIDPSMRGKNARIKLYKFNDWGSDSKSGYLNFVDINGNVISKISVFCQTSYDSIYTIPTNAVRIAVTCDVLNGSYLQVFEIEASNEPTFSSTNGYMLLTADPTKAIKDPYQMVSIGYFSTSVQRLYRIGTTGDWLTYQDQPIEVIQGQTIYAKGIDQNGNETRITSSYTVNVTNAMKKEAYDGNINTAAVEYSGNGIMDIDPSMRGKNARIKLYKYNTGGSDFSYGYLNFVDINGNVISQIAVYCQNSYDSIYTIPTNAVRITVTCNGGSGAYMQVYEIQPSNEPTFNVTNGYMLLTADSTKAIRDPYQIVTVNYFPTSVQRLYRIGTTGDWLTYQDQPIKVIQGQTIYAKGIDLNGNETRIVSSLTVNVTNAMKKEAYDGDFNTAAVEYSGNGIMDIDSSMRGKNARIKLYKYNTGGSDFSYGYLNFVDINGSVISQISVYCQNSYDSTYTIPANAVKITVTCNGGSGAYMQVYEIQPII